MEPLKPVTKDQILATRPQASPADLEEYERLLAQRFTVDPHIASAPDPRGVVGEQRALAAPQPLSAAAQRELRLAQLHQKLFGNADSRE